MQIVFSGTDGAGKSTQITKLKETLNSHKIEVVWSRGGYTPIFKAIKVTLKKFTKRKFTNSNANIAPKKNTNDKSNLRGRLFKNKFFVSAWLFVSILDLMIFYGFYLRYLNFKGVIIICDRYIDDTLLDFSLNFPSSFNPNSLLWKLLKLVTPKTKFSFLLYVTPLVSQQRAILKNDPYPDSIETLDWRYLKYLDEKIFPSQVYIKINCEQSIDEVHQVIIKELDL